MPLSQVVRIEEGVQRLSKRVPRLPAAESLILRVITILGRDLAARFDQLLEPIGLSEMEFRAMMALYSHEPGTAHPSDLCTSLAQSPANMTRVSDALVERGLITRLLSEQDRRRVVMQLTPAGEQLVRDLLPSMFTSTRELFRDFSAADKTRLLGDLKRVMAALDDAPAPGGAESST